MTDEPETTIEATLDHRPGIMGIHASRAVERLKAGKPGDTNTREEMAEVIGRSCRPSQLGYGNVLSAINRVEIDHGIVWRWDRGTRAWVCLDDTAKTGVLKDLANIREATVRVIVGHLTHTYPRAALKVTGGVNEKGELGIEIYPLSAPIEEVAS